MNMFKKRVILLAIITILAIILSGCATKPVAEQQKAPETPAVPTPPAIPEEQPAAPPAQELPAQIPAQQGNFLTTKDNYKIAYNYYPAGDNSPAVILLHMAESNSSSWDEYAKQLQENGVSSIAIDLRGHGKSDGDLTRFTDEDYNKMVLDVEAAKEFLKTQSIDASRIAIIGASIGANIALKYAATDKGIKGIILLSAGLDYHGVKTEDAMKSYDRPVLIVASLTDEYAASSAQTLYDLSTNGDLNFFKVAGHGTEMFNKFSNLDKFIIDWLQVHI